ncbi:hypothetical protein GL263_08960 [Streptomyces durbertensis]|uniref:Secreted protein n=1 Tax=Streptomyces durbertensis TaxID=2448886 RepID=A0ABR6EEC8_9ACTN|nr:hypothetical protein [Streptomyces durbertensis]MBB1243687.1 hypothetical protein [Streptomyces durbertensis]
MRTNRTRRTPQLRRAARLRVWTAALALAGTALIGGAAPALADGDDGENTGDNGTVTEAGTTFRGATVLRDGQEGRAAASSSDYLYWAFGAGAGQRPTVSATVRLPESSSRSGTSRWQLSLHDGLRRAQPCAAGTHTRTARQDAAEVRLRCTLRPVQPWADTWSEDPLPGAYFVRVAAVGLPEQDRGLPIEVSIEVDAGSAGGARRGGGDLGSPLIPSLHAGTALAGGDGGDSVEDNTEGRRTLELAEPDGGWSGSWWSDRWLWTAGGGVAGALAAVGGYLWVRRPRV